MDRLNASVLEAQLANTTEVTLRLGTAANQESATAVKFRQANFRPGPAETARIRFVFDSVTAWHADTFVVARSAMEEAGTLADTAELAIDWCCAPPVRIRNPPERRESSAVAAPTAAAVAAAVIVAVRAPSSCP